MHIKRKRRIYLLVVLILGVSGALALSLYALGQNMNLYYTPTQVFKEHIPNGRIFRLGGMVVTGSVQRVPNSLKVSFILTDFHHKIKVSYNGILPSLFRVGQGIVAQGRLSTSGVFIADQVLAKHDATYHPPNIKKETT